MHGRGYSQAGQGPYPPPPPFQQLPFAPPSQSASSQQGHNTLRPAGIQQAPSFPLPLAPPAYPHALPGPPLQGRHIPVPSNMVNSGQSYFTQPPPPQGEGSTKVPHSYPTSQQHLPWNGSMNQMGPLPGSSPLPPHGHIMDRGPSHFLPSQYALPPQPPMAAPPQPPPPGPPPPPPYSSRPSFAAPDPSVSFVELMHQDPHIPSKNSLPPPPPPPQTSSGAPPLPASLPCAVDNASQNDRSSTSNEDEQNGGNSINEFPPPVKLVGNKIAQNETIDSGPEAEKRGNVVAYSPSDSDMDMEDDITQPDEQQENYLSNISYPTSSSISNLVDAQKQLQATQHTGRDGFATNAPDGNLRCSGSSVLEEQKFGCGILSDHALPANRSSKFEYSSITANGDTQCSLNNNVKKSASSAENSSQQKVPVASAESGSEKREASPFRLLQGYSSDYSVENEDKNRLRNVSTSPINSPRVSKEADATSLATGETKESNERTYEKIKSAKDGNSREKRQSKDSLTKFDRDAGRESGSPLKPDPRNSSTELNVDEFGRLIREGARESDTSNSPHYTRRRSRRGRNRSRSHSPRDSRRRRRNERHDQSRSLSPKRRRSRSRSPGLRRGHDLGRYKQRRDKGQLPECSDFRRGKCYRGASCRYSHHEPDKSERRYSRGKLQNYDYPPPSKSTDLFEKISSSSRKSVHEYTEVKDKGIMSGLQERGLVNEPLVDPTIRGTVMNSMVPPTYLTTDAAARNLSDLSSQAIPLGNENCSVGLSAAHCNDGFLQTDDQKPQQINNNLIPESSSNLSMSLIQDVASELPYVGNPAVKAHSTVEVLSADRNELSPANPSRLPPPLLSVSQVSSAPSMAQFETRTENYPSVPIPQQNFHFSLPPNSSSSSLLAPPGMPFVNDPTIGEGRIPSQQIRQSQLPPRSDYSDHTSMRSHPTEFTSSQVHVSNLMSQSHGGPNAMGEDRFIAYPVQGVYPLNAYAQPTHFSMQSPSEGTRAFGQNLPPNGSSHVHPFFHPSSYRLQHSASDCAYGQLADTEGNFTSSTNRATPDLLERNQPSSVPGFVGSRISNHLNPYVSTFDQPPSSKYNSNLLYLEKDEYGAPLGNLSSSMVSTRYTAQAAEGILPRPGGDQYDPLFDSIEPSLNSSLRKTDRLRKHETTVGSNIMPTYSGSSKALDVEESNKQKGIGAIPIDVLVDNEEIGETADAEVGAFENYSPSSPNDAADMTAGEIEIDQVKASGKKKGRDSRSMKLFKISIANFVKEVLKPSWRQGNMSKEAFKTIVKKTVDKVSGTMKSHRIPKSQAKINHYIDSSQGKLTKLVMGYVDKYVKV